MVKLLQAVQLMCPKAMANSLYKYKEKAEHNANWPKDQVNPTSINCNDKKKIKELVGGGGGGNFTSETVRSTIVQPTQTNISITVIFRVKPFKHGYSRSILEIGQ